MKTLLFPIVGLALLAMPAVAADDPIAVRQVLMSSNGASAAVAGAVLKGELDYSPVVAKSVFTSMAAVAQAFGDYFPEGSADPARSDAAPRIWEDAAGFETELTEFREITATALEAAGKDGPADAAAFQAALQPVLGTCRSCHETYRLEN